MKPKTAPVLVALLTLTIVQFQIVASGSGIALPGCPETCGDIQITYPFGIGPGCSLPGFELSCKTPSSSNGSPVPFLLNDIPVLEISLSWAQVRVNKSVTSSCSSPQQTSSNTTNSWNLSGTPYWISQVQNTFTIIGCDIIAIISYGNGTNMFQGGCVTTGCYSQNSIINGFCSGLGCCQTDIPLEINSYQVTLQPWNYNSSKQQNSSQCGYAVLADSFETSYNDIINDKLYKQQQMPLVLDWSIGDESCDTAQANKFSYACVSDNSLCVDTNHTIYIGSYQQRTVTSSGPGYLCFCSMGYQGNPYLEGGCVGISLSLSLSLALKFTLPVHFDHYIGAYLEIQRTYK